MTITHDYLSLPEYYTRPSRKATKYYCGLAHSTLRQTGEMGARSSKFKFAGNSRFKLVNFSHWQLELE